MQRQAEIENSTFLLSKKRYFWFEQPLCTYYIYTAFDKINFWKKQIIEDSVKKPDDVLA